MEEKRTFGLSGFALKILATVTMLIDHIGACGLVGWGETYLAFRIIGRVAFPIYCFLLAEGAMKTRRPLRYLLRLLLFGILSELPYDLLFHRSLLEFGNQNIMFTLFFGLAGILACRWSRQFDGNWKELLGPLGMLAALALAELLHCDYGWQGILLIYAMYIWRSERWERSHLYLLLVLCFFGSMWWRELEIWALAAFLPLYFYNGRKGYSFSKYVFYGFYPGHLLILLILCVILGLSTGLSAGVFAL